MKKQCSVNDCLGKYYAKGYCEKHYQRTSKYGTPDAKKGDHVPLEVKFWKEVDKNGESVTPVGTPCWIWTGYAPKGYGRVWLNGQNERAHRASWLMAYGDIPEGLNVLHKCDTTRCVRPDHLFLGTHADNVRDRSAKGRSRTGNHQGENSGRAKLKVADILAIRADARLHRQIAADYKIDATSVCNIKRRKTWKHIP